MLLEAVPNLSLGPDDEALEAILDTLDTAASPGWALLDVHTDPDHNRTVLTLAGAPSPLTRALATLVDACIEHASLVGHEGVHPRVGLLDVLPLVPLESARDQDAKRTARLAAEALARAGVPVVYYGRLAAREEHTRLAAIRRELDWPGAVSPLGVAPDRGPSTFHPTMGASCVGVRDPLIAYNVLLDTTDRATGDEIARAIRAATGGLPGVQALAFALASREDRVQVSTNITDVDATTPADVFDAVRQRAAAAGVEIVEGELVGLAPERALPERPAEMGLGARPVSLEAHLEAAGFPAGMP